MDLDWDPEIDAPATVAVIGGGPAGVEAALYARFLGYHVILFEKYRIGSALAAWGERPLAAAWQDVTSSIGWAALEAQGTYAATPEFRDHVSCKQYVEEYLIPLAKTDLLQDAIQIQSPVASISRLGCPPSLPDLETSMPIANRAEREFRLLIDSQKRGQHAQIADIVLDCSGRHFPGGLATGGGLAAGEGAALLSLRQSRHADGFYLGKVDVEFARRLDFAGKHTLVYGANAAACANVLELLQLSQEVANTRITWVIPKWSGHLIGRHAVQVNSTSVVDLQLAADVPENIVEQVRSVLQNEQMNLGVLPASGIEAIARQTPDAEKGGGKATWKSHLVGAPGGSVELECDCVIACGPEATDWSPCKPLLIEAEKKGVTASTTAGPTSNALPHSPLATVVTAEPHYYVLGEKTAAGAITFDGIFKQIQSLFARVGGRSELNLYETVQPRELQWQATTDH